MHAHLRVECGRNEKLFIEEFYEVYVHTIQLNSNKYRHKL